MDTRGREGSRLDNKDWWRLQLHSGPPFLLVSLRGDMLSRGISRDGVNVEDRHIRTTSETVCERLENRETKIPQPRTPYLSDTSKSKLQRNTP